MAVVLITRQGCHLCELAQSLLHELGVEAQLLNVDSDDELHRLYDFRVPVILVDGRVVAEGRLDRETLRKAIQPV